MLALVVEFRIKPAFVDAFEVAILENARQSCDTEAGCRQFDVCLDLSDQGLFFLYELYDDEAAIQAHLQSAHFQHMNQISAHWVASKTVRQFRRSNT